MNRPKRTPEPIVLVPAVLTAVITIAIAFQQPFDRVLFQTSLGFTLFTAAWTGMYLALRRELPDHPLSNAKIVTLHLGWGRHPGLRPMLKVIGFHFERRRIDLWSALLILGGLLLVTGIGEYALTR